MDAVAERPIDRQRSAVTCRWATLTLFLPAPFWFDAEACPWSCLRDAAPRVLATTDPCATCPRWEQRAPVAETPDQKRETTASEAATPLMMDWLGGFPPPHEIR
jgi:hypothetical protein